MFPLIISILLGLLLLFVIVLLVTELAATYPVWKQFNEGLDAVLPTRLTAKNGEKGNTKLLLLVLFCLLGFCMVAIIVGNALQENEPPLLVQGETASRPAKKAFKSLTETSSDNTLSFFLQLKWENGKLYGNNKIVVDSSAASRFSDWRYYLLDKEGFLIKEIAFFHSDLIYQGTGDKATTLLNRFSEELPEEDFEKINRLQVVADRRLLTPPLNLP